MTSARNYKARVRTRCARVREPVSDSKRWARPNGARDTTICTPIQEYATLHDVSYRDHDLPVTPSCLRSGLFLQSAFVQQVGCACD